MPVGSSVASNMELRKGDRIRVARVKDRVGTSPDLKKKKYSPGLSKGFGTF